jgi:hypothetical protein
MLQPVFSLIKRDTGSSFPVFLDATRKEFSASTDLSSWLWY